MMEYPKSVSIRIHENCNAQCIMCSRWKKNQPVIFNSNNLEAIFKDLCSYGVRRVFFTGGEPTLYDDFIPILRKAREAGLRMGFVTNGSKLSTEYVSELSQIGIEYIKVSIDSHKSEIHDRIRGYKGLWQKAVNGLAMISKMHVCDLVSINYLINKLNVKEAEKIIALAERCGFNQIEFSLPHYGMISGEKNMDMIRLDINDLQHFYFQKVPMIIQKGLEHGIRIKVIPFFNELEGKETNQIIEELKYHRKRYKDKLNSFSKEKYSYKNREDGPCNLIRDAFEIKSDGSIYLCCYHNNSYDFLMGNIFSKKIAEIWEDEKYIRLRNTNMPVGSKCVLCKLGHGRVLEKTQLPAR